LLLPTHTLGQDYVHLSGARGWGTGSLITVVGTQNNTTVTITPRSNSAAGTNGLPAMTAGQPTQININRYDYLQIGVIDQNLGIDIVSTSGSIISANKPVALFGGHSCAAVPGEPTPWC